MSRERKRPGKDTPALALGAHYRSNAMRKRIVILLVLMGMSWGFAGEAQGEFKAGISVREKVRQNLKIQSCALQHGIHISSSFMTHPARRTKWLNEMANRSLVQQLTSFNETMKGWCLMA